MPDVLCRNSQTHVLSKVIYARHALADRVKLLKNDEKGKKYQADHFKIFYRNRGSISGGNAKNVEEIIYLITGSAEITLRQATRKITAPARIHFPARTFHQIKALTDISFILFEK